MHRSGPVVSLMFTCALAACAVSGTGRSMAADAAGDTHPASAAIDHPPRLPATVSASLDHRHSLQIDTGDIAFHLRASHCLEYVPGLDECSGDVAVEFMHRDTTQRQTLQPERVWVDARDTLYRGTLDSIIRRRHPTFVVSDVNFDGHEDILIRSGRDGAYGAPSYDVYLLDERQGRFVHNRAFSDLTVGYLGLFEVEDGILRVDTRETCCIHIRESYIVTDDIPVLMERLTEETDGNGKFVRSATERRIDGTMRVVPDTR